MSSAKLVPAPLEFEELSFEELDPELVVAGEVGVAPLDLHAVGGAELGGGRGEGCPLVALLHDLTIDHA